MRKRIRRWLLSLTKKPSRASRRFAVIATRWFVRRAFLVMHGTTGSSRATRIMRVRVATISIRHPMRAAVAYYRSRAPEHLTFPEPVAAATKLGTTFVVEKLPFTPVDDIPPATAHLRWTRLDPESDPVLLTCDLRYGSVAAIDLRKRELQPRMLAQLNNPCHIEPCDLDGDQAIDLVVADAGTEYGLDHQLGRIVWLRRQAGTDRFDPVVLASGLGRPADVRPTDLDGDGDT